MNGKRRLRTWHLALVWLGLLLGFYGFGIRTGRLFAGIFPPCVSCNCANLNFWSVQPYGGRVRSL